MARGENIIEGSSMTNGDTKVLGRANDEHFSPTNVVQRGPKLGATTGSNEDSLSSVQVETSSLGKDIEATFKNGKVGDKIIGTNSNIIGIETDVNIGRASNHIVQNIHQQNEERWRERATLFDPRVEVNTKRV